ncbi:hypothetical protein [Herbaspirillum sp. YR522]|uniref:hypothetical protein n=1 Tax=Herbaspirillum sp. YR522 TaxID=1144342 RepID=UPI00026FCCE5|nr:hypothetical protein [Herbaspirillum sp. YR522]EJN09614.1 hypothetical protein PMI40_00622 [Herbaspirillum sp. YR522]
MMDRLATPENIAYCLGLADNPRLHEVDRQIAMHAFVDKSLAQECYNGYAEYKAPALAEVTRSQRQAMLAALDALNTQGLTARPQDPSAQAQPMPVMSWRRRQQEKVRNLFHPGTARSVQEQMSARRSATNYHIEAAQGGGLARPARPRPNARGTISVALAPADLPRLIDLMPEIFRRFGTVLDEAKVTAPASQHLRSESARFYLHGLDDKDQALARALLGFLQHNLPNARWRNAAPGQLNIDDIGKYGEELRPEGQPKRSLGSHRAAQVGHAMTRCFMKYGHDAEQRHRHFATELKAILRQDGYRVDCPALLAARPDRPARRR